MGKVYALESLRKALVMCVKMPLNRWLIFKWNKGFIVEAKQKVHVKSSLINWGLQDFFNLIRHGWIECCGMKGIRGEREEDDLTHKLKSTNKIKKNLNAVCRFPPIQNDEEE